MRRDSSYSSGGKTEDSLGRACVGPPRDDATAHRTWDHGRRSSSSYTTLHYTTLHYTTLHYTTLRYATLRYTTLHYTTLHYTTLHYTTLHYTTLHYTTLHYTTLHYTTLHYTTLHYTTLHYTTQATLPFVAALSFSHQTPLHTPGACTCSCHLHIPHTIASPWDVQSPQNCCRAVEQPSSSCAQACSDQVHSFEGPDGSHSPLLFPVTLGPRSPPFLYSRRVLSNAAHLHRSQHTCPRPEIAGQQNQTAPAGSSR